jgi:hypothetical protein
VQAPEQEDRYSFLLGLGYDVAHLLGLGEWLRFSPVVGVRSEYLENHRYPAELFGVAAGAVAVVPLHEWVDLLGRYTVAGRLYGNDYSQADQGVIVAVQSLLAGVGVNVWDPLALRVEYGLDGLAFERELRMYHTVFLTAEARWSL